MELKVGDRVRISKDSKYYNNGTSNHPHCEGEIKYINSRCCVKWDNDISNTYDITDLEWVIPECWYCIVTKENKEALNKWRFKIFPADIVEEGGIIGMGKWYVDKLAQKAHNHGPKPTIKCPNYTFGQEITTEQFYEHILKQPMKTYRLIKEYPGSSTIGTTTTEDMSKFPEYWEEVKDDFKVGDWVIGWHNEDLRYSFNAWEIGKIDEEYFYPKQNLHLNHNTSKSKIRKATQEEIEKATSIYIGEYKVEKVYIGDFKIGCQWIAPSEMGFIKKLIKSPINADITIHGTKITLDLINKIENL